MKTRSKILLSLLMTTSAAPVWAQNQCEGVHALQALAAAHSLSAAQVNALLEQALSPGPQQSEARRKAQEALHLDDMNFVYYATLFLKNKSGGEAGSLKLHPATDSRLIAYPVGTENTPPALRSLFKSVNYGTIVKQFTGRHAKRAVVILQKLQAGTGSSMTRLNYFKSRPEMASLLGMKAGAEMALGAKGTDLLVTIDHPLKPGKKIEITIAELQLLQAWQTARTSPYSQLIVQDIVGPETRNRLSEIWQKKSLIDPKRTYAELFATIEGLGRAPSIFQSHVPALNDQGQISFNRLAPAGHGLFAVNALRAVLKKDLLPKTESDEVITAIANGEDLNSLPDPVIVDWVVKNKVAITLVTTSKTAIDVKGGLLTLVKDSQTGETYLKVVDTAEAKAAGQLDVFEKSGGIASTNLTLFNYKVLNEKLKGLSEDQLLQAMAPDLVPNWKEQTDKDGVKRKYLQLEGTMGTVIMNLDRYYRKIHGEPLVQVVNVEAHRRTDFFSPIKSAFDYYLQFHSDRFKVDEATYKLVHLGGAELPSFNLKDPGTKDAFYQDVQNVLTAFKGSSMLRVKDLQVTGQIQMQNSVFVGTIKLINETGKIVDIASLADRLPKSADGRMVLQDIEIKWTEAGVSIGRNGT